MRRVFLALALLMTLTACREAEERPIDLGARIRTANTSQYCRKADNCLNPDILINEAGFDITYYDGSKALHVSAGPKALRQKILSLPMSAWPRGASISIVPTCVISDQSTLAQNVKEANKVLRSLGLAVDYRPAG